MRIGLDVDGVMYNFVDTANWLLRGEFGVTVEGDFSDKDLTTEQWEWLWTTGIEKGLFRHGHMYKGTAEAIKQLTKMGHDIVIITKRWRNGVQDTIDWLAYHRFPAAEVHVLGEGRKKSSIKCDLYVEDTPRHAVDLAANTTGAVLLWDRPWNRWAFKDQPHDTYPVRVYNWDQVLFYVDRIDNGR